jgi:hypothetical protein
VAGHSLDYPKATRHHRGIIESSFDHRPEKGVSVLLSAIKAAVETGTDAERRVDGQ